MSQMNYYTTLAKTRAKVDILPSELATIRDKAITALETMNVPNRKDEVWKYTNMAKDLDYEFKLSHHQEAESKVFHKVEGFINLFFHNGVFNKDSSDEVNFKMLPLSELSNENCLQLIKKVYTGSDDISETMNKALLKNGYLYQFSKDYHSTTPILLHRYYDNEDGLNSETHFYEVASHTHVQVLETLTNKSKNFINLTQHFNVNKNSTIELHTLQDLSSNSLALCQVNAEVARDGHFYHSGITLGAEKSRTQIYIDLKEENSFADAHGLYALHKDQHHDTSSYIHHRSAHTESSQLYKGILADSSRGVFTGKVRIDKNAQQVNAGQLNKNLLLSTKAQANSRPQLEIYADDVKCAHGSTTGQLSQDELFYFLARGIKEEKARQILAKAFANDVLFKIKDQKIRSYLMNYLTNKQIEANHV